MSKDRVTISTIASSMTTFAVLALLVYLVLGDLGIPLALLVIFMGVLRQVWRFMGIASPELVEQASRQPPAPDAARNFSVAGVTCLAAGIVIFLGMYLPASEPLAGAWGSRAGTMFVAAGGVLLATARLLLK